ncbi:hypothetical protein C3L33_03023, partial [Rhododendron williamsianum]
MLSSMTTSAAFAFFVCFLITIPNFHVCSNHSHNDTITCFENERDALLKFKQDLKDPMNRLSSWDVGEDCCQWTGVFCDKFTGHVRAHIPSFIGSIATLRYLNLSAAGFSRTIPPQLGNVTAMRYLDLQSNYGLLSGNLQWLSRLVLLQHLDMSDVDLSKALDWLQVTSNLPSLVELHLSDCELKYVVSPSSTNKINFTSLDVLNLSINYHLGSSIPGWILSLNHLISLDLSECLFEGPLPSGLQNMTSLGVLDWSGNPSNSTIPDWLYSLSHLQSLSLSGNRLHGAVSIAIENLTSLVNLDLSGNQLQGSIPTSLRKLCKLKTISLSYNEFFGEVADIFVGFSRCKSNELQTFHSGENHLLGHLPYELGQLTSLVYLDLSNNSFSGPIPVSIGRLSSLISLELSINNFNGTLPESLGRLKKLESLDLSVNNFSRTLPESLGRLES